MTDQLAEAREPLSIIELRAQNVMRLRVARIRFDPNNAVTVVSGRNGQGKSSVLAAVAMALGGKDFVPPVPIRKGESWGEIVVDLGKYVVRRSFLNNGTTSLVVTQGKEGAKIASPQGLLNSFVGDLTFDPLAFARMKPPDQAETLRKLAGIDFSGTDNLRAIAYDDRTAVNRDVTKLRARLAAMPHHADAPADPVDVAEIADRLSAAQTFNAAHKRMRDDLVNADNFIANQAEHVAKLRRELEQQEQKLTALHKERSQLVQQLDGMRDADLVPLRGQLTNAEAINRKVRENAERERVTAELATANAKSDELTNALQEIDDAKTKTLADAKLPVPGLGFTIDGAVTFNGLPLEQASGAEQLRVSVAVGAARNPRLRIMLVRDGSLLDNDSMLLLGNLARDAGAQLIVERVEIDQHTTVVIEDGEVVDLPDASPDAPAESPTGEAPAPSTAG